MRSWFSTTSGGRCVIAAIVLAAACDSATDPGPRPHSITATPNPLTIPQLGSQQLVPLVFDQDSALISGITVTFASSDTTKVRVSKGGMVTSVGPAGTATVNLRAGNATESVPVTVTAVRAAISVTPNPVTIPQKTTISLDAKVLDAIGVAVPGASLTYTTSNPALFTVSSTGVITSVGPAGVGQVLVEHDALQKLVPVAITQVPTSIRMNRSSVLLITGGQMLLSGAVLDANGDPVSGAPLTYSSSNTNRVTVSNAGLVQSVGGTGPATITVQFGALSTTVDVEVVNAARPSGNLFAQPFVGAAPWGIAVSSADLVYVTTLGDGVIRKSPIASPQFTIAHSNFSLPISVAFSSDGTTAFASVDNGVAILDVATGTTVTTVTGFTGNNVFSVAVSPDGQTLAIGTANSLHLMDIATRSITANFTTPGSVNGLVFSPDGLRLYASQFNHGIVAEFNPQTKNHVRDIVALGTPQGIGLSADGLLLFVAKEAGSKGMEIINLSTNQRDEIETGGGCFGLAVVPDQTEVWLACGANVLAVHISTRTIRANVSTGGFNRRIALTASGLVAVVTNDNGNIYFID